MESVPRDPRPFFLSRSDAAIELEPVSSYVETGRDERDVVPEKENEEDHDQAVTQILVVPDDGFCNEIL